jgi:hypothetical protein
VQGSRGGGGEGVGVGVGVFEGVLERAAENHGWRLWWWFVERREKN